MEIAQQPLALEADKRGASEAERSPEKIEQCSTMCTTRRPRNMGAQTLFGSDTLQDAGAVNRAGLI